MSDGDERSREKQSMKVNEETVYFKTAGQGSLDLKVTVG